MPVPHVLIRAVDADVLSRLKERAREHGRSLEAELGPILKEAAQDEAATVTPELERLWRLFEGRSFSDSTQRIREDRER